MFLQHILNSPVATIVAVVIALGSIAFIWYYCLPAFEENKKLKAELEDARAKRNDKVGDDLESILGHHASLNKILSDLQSEIAKNPDRAFERIQEALSSLKDGDKDNNATLSDLRIAINSILESAQNTRLRDETLHNHINELLRYMYGINEKQNQIISALLGISRIQDNNRGIL